MLPKAYVGFASSFASRITSDTRHQFESAIMREQAYHSRRIVQSADGPLRFRFLHLSLHSSGSTAVHCSLEVQTDQTCGREINVMLTSCNYTSPVFNQLSANCFKSAAGSPLHAFAQLWHNTPDNFFTITHATLQALVPQFGCAQLHPGYFVPACCFVKTETESHFVVFGVSVEIAVLCAVGRTTTPSRGEHVRTRTPTKIRFRGRFLIQSGTKEERNQEMKVPPNTSLTTYSS